MGEQNKRTPILIHAAENGCACVEMFSVAFNLLHLTKLPHVHPVGERSQQNGTILPATPQKIHIPNSECVMLTIHRIPDGSTGISRPLAPCTREGTEKATGAAYENCWIVVQVMQQQRDLRSDGRECHEVTLKKNLSSPDMWDLEGQR